MTIAAPPAATWLVDGDVTRSLGLLQHRLEDLAAAAAADFPPEAVGHGLVAGGKRLRPTIAFLMGRFGSGSEARVLEVACALELLHVASLYHDDVLDGAELRRGRPTLEHRFGRRTAILAGDAVLALATELLSSCGEMINREAADAIVATCEGQALEMRAARAPEALTLEDCLGIVSRKTGTLFEGAARLGARAGGARSGTVAAAGRYGRHVGIAYQIIDDILDLADDGRRLGKPPGADARRGVTTLPVVLALREGGGPIRQAVLGAWRDGDDDALAQLLWDCGAIRAATGLAAGHLEEAEQAAAGLGTEPAAAVCSLVGLVASLRVRLPAAPAALGR